MYSFIIDLKTYRLKLCIVVNYAGLLEFPINTFKLPSIFIIKKWYTDLLVNHVNSN